MSSAETTGFLKVLRGLAEPLLALAGAFAVTALLTLPLVPIAERLEIPLRPAADRQALDFELLEQRVVSLAVAAETRVLLLRGKSRLVLSGVDDPDRARLAVGDLLVRSGYQRAEFDQRRMPDVDALLEADSRRLPAVMTIQAVVFSAAGLLLARRRVGGPLKPVPQPTSKAALVGVAAGIAAVLLSGALGALLELAGLPVEEQPWLERLFEDRAALLRIAPWIVLIVPASEEIFFRLYVFRFIAHHAGLATGLVASSLLFSLTHFNPSGLLIYLGIGCIFAWAYHRTGRLAAPIAGHVTLNAIVLVVSQFVHDLPV